MRWKRRVFLIREIIAGPLYLRTHLKKNWQVVCKSCGGILLNADAREEFLRKMRKPNLDSLQRGAIFKKVVEAAKKNKQCFTCGAYNGVVKKAAGAPTLKLLHEKFKGRAAEHELGILGQQLSSAMAFSGEVATHLGKAYEDLSPLFVLELLKRISDEDCELLWMNPKVNAVGGKA